MEDTKKKKKLSRKEGENNGHDNYKAKHPQTKDMHSYYAVHDFMTFSSCIAKMKNTDHIIESKLQNEMKIEFLVQFEIQTTCFQCDFGVYNVISHIFSLFHWPKAKIKSTHQQHMCVISVEMCHSWRIVYIWLVRCYKLKGINKILVHLFS